MVRFHHQPRGNTVAGRDSKGYAANFSQIASAGLQIFGVKVSQVLFLEVGFD